MKREEGRGEKMGYGIESGSSGDLFFGLF